MNPVVHFEMPYDDPDRVSKFYQAVFGWKMVNLGEQMGGYVLATTTATSPDRIPREPGAINGGFFAKSPDFPPSTSVVINTRDIRKSMAAVTAAGGQVHGEPMDIPGIGAYVAISDSEGNRVGILQPLPMAKPAKKKPAAKKSAARKPSKKAAKKKPARKR